MNFDDQILVEDFSDIFAVSSIHAGQPTHIVTAALIPTRICYVAPDEKVRSPVLAPPIQLRVDLRMVDHGVGVTHWRHERARAGVDVTPPMSWIGRT
jgi:hypothetical protein